MGDSRLSIERSSTAAPLPPPGAVHQQPICARLVRLWDRTTGARAPRAPAKLRYWNEL